MAEPTKQRPGDRPLPRGGRHNVQDYLVDIIRVREQLGIERYGSPLMTQNGRDAATDALEEAVDLAAYLTQLQMERADEARAVRRLLAELNLLAADRTERRDATQDDLWTAVANASVDVLVLFADRFSALDGAAADGTRRATAPAGGDPK